MLEAVVGRDQPHLRTVISASLGLPIDPPISACHTRDNDV